MTAQLLKDLNILPKRMEIVGYAYLLSKTFLRCYESDRYYAYIAGFATGNYLVLEDIKKISNWNFIPPYCIYFNKKETFWDFVDRGVIKI